MQFFTIVALALATVAPAFAAPAAEAEAEAKTVEKRDLSIQVCEGAFRNDLSLVHPARLQRCTVWRGCPRLLAIQHPVLEVLAVSALT
ncbi:hypothetical protein BKA70DRAFT_1278246, partial [Coprinopsis sp. MPI-PUGE-AT-0042]